MQVTTLEKFFLSLPSDTTQLDIDKIDYPLVASCMKGENDDDDSDGNDDDDDSDDDNDDCRNNEDDDDINQSESSLKIDVTSLKELVSDVIQCVPEGLKKSVNESVDHPLSSSGCNKNARKNGDVGRKKDDVDDDNGIIGTPEPVASSTAPYVVDWEILHWGGLTCDSTPLPHHVSDAEEVDRLLQAFEKFLKETFFGSEPGIVKVSRLSLLDCLIIVS